MEFNVTFFGVFNPVHVLVMLLLLQQSSVFIVLLVNIVVSAQLFWIIQKYTLLLADKQIHFEQVYHEYNVKFVNRRLFTRKQDVGTSPVRVVKQE